MNTKWPAVSGGGIYCVQNYLEHVKQLLAGYKLEPTSKLLKAARSKGFRAHLRFR